ncbi:hypothetical protein ACIP2X_37625 [Streptomyces sp. NPDC089424]
MTTTAAPELPQPRAVFQHGDLFVEPVYEDGQPYAEPDDEDDDEPAIITP